VGCSSPEWGTKHIARSELKQRMDHGYRPFTFGELRDSISSLMSTNAALTEELKTLKAAPNQQATMRGPTEGELRQAEAQQRREMQRQALLMFHVGTDAEVHIHARSADSRLPTSSCNQLHYPNHRNHRVHGLQLTLLLLSLPSRYDQRIEPILPRLNPLGIGVFGSLDARVTEQL